MQRARALFAALALLGLGAFQQCPPVTGGSSKQWFGFPITSATYDTTSLVLYVIFGAKNPTAYSAVPLSVWQGFVRATNPVTYWQSQVNPYYRAMLLFETTNCPLLTTQTPSSSTGPPEFAGTLLWTN